MGNSNANQSELLGFEKTALSTPLLLDVSDYDKNNRIGLDLQDEGIIDESRPLPHTLTRACVTGDLLGNRKASVDQDVENLFHDKSEDVLKRNFELQAQLLEVARKSLKSHLNSIHDQSRDEYKLNFNEIDVDPPLFIFINFLRNAMESFFSQAGQRESLSNQVCYENNESFTDSDSNNDSDSETDSFGDHYGFVCEETTTPHVIPDERVSSFFSRENADEERVILDKVASVYKEIAYIQFHKNQFDETDSGIKHDDNVAFSFSQMATCNDAPDNIISNSDGNTKKIHCCEEIAEYFLDWAISCKNANNMEDYVAAHMQRMHICPIFFKTDAIRLLGLKSSKPFIFGGQNNDAFQRIVKDEVENAMYEVHVEVQEICDKGIFELINNDLDSAEDKHLQSRNDNFHRLPPQSQKRSVKCYRPSQNAKMLGRRVREIFFSNQYTLQQSAYFLLPFIKKGEGKIHDPTSNCIFSGDVFFSHRFDFLLSTSKSSTNNSGASNQNQRNALEVLVSLFLFGLAVDTSTVVQAVGIQNVHVLIDAALLRISPVNCSHFVGEVQIYPLHVNEFNLNENMDSKRDIQNTDTLFFVSDWPLESMRLPKDAIMPVGYDTLELLSLSSACDHLKNDREVAKVLDLCCGNGIQGLFAWAVRNRNRSNISYVQTAGEKDQLVCIDINERACHFVTANIALNDLENCREDESDIVVLCGDLYEPLEQSSNSRKFRNVDFDEDCENQVGDYGNFKNKFSVILCNPPFVAEIPCINLLDRDKMLSLPEYYSNVNALYAKGGGIHGMNTLNRIMGQCLDYLKISNKNDMRTPSNFVLMVTEVPNVESSCYMIQKMLPHSEQENVRIHIAYVEDDVESFDEYMTKRQHERGCFEIECDQGLGKNYVSLMNSDDTLNEDEGINGNRVVNRALVLIALSHFNCPSGENMLKLSKFRSKKTSKSSSWTSVTDENKKSSKIDEESDDEEDLFLTAEGIEFTRSNLLR